MPREHSESAAPTRRSQRLRAAQPPLTDVTPVASATSEPTAVQASAVTAPEIATAALSRRARRLAAAGAAVVPPVISPQEPLTAPTDVIADASVETIDAAPAQAAPARKSEASSASGAAASDVDVFAAAAEAFGFAAADDDPVADDAAEVPAADEAVTVGATPEGTHVAPRRTRVMRRVAATGASFGIMGVAGLIAVSMTLPVSAVSAVKGPTVGASTSIVASSAAPQATELAEDEIQAYVASADIVDEALVRDESFSTVSMSDMAAEAGIQFSQSLYTNDPEAAIQWPFKVGVAMSSGYGQRWGRLHAGIDLVPGAGAPIQAIADGTVRIATESGGAYGVTVYIDHVIDGQVVTSHYAHMQYGSLRVKAGQKVQVGDIVGKVGNTGRSYGAHLHFEIIINGSTVDPLPWMQRNAGRYEY